MKSPSPTSPQKGEAKIVKVWNDISFMKQYTVEIKNTFCLKRNILITRRPKRPSFGGVGEAIETFEICFD